MVTQLPEPANTGRQLRDQSLHCRITRSCLSTNSGRKLDAAACWLALLCLQLPLPFSMLKHHHPRAKLSYCCSICACVQATVKPGINASLALQSRSQVFNIALVSLEAIRLLRGKRNESVACLVDWTLLQSGARIKDTCGCKSQIALNCDRI